MSAVIFDERDGKILKHYRTFRGAKCAHTRMCKKADCPTIVAATMEYYMKTGGIKASQMVTVKNLMTGADTQIRRDEVGGPCDPSMERFWSM